MCQRTVGADVALTKHFLSRKEIRGFFLPANTSWAEVGVSKIFWGRVSRFCWGYAGPLPAGTFWAAVGLSKKTSWTEMDSGQTVSGAEVVPREAAFSPTRDAQMSVFFKKKTVTRYRRTELLNFCGLPPASKPQASTLSHVTSI